MVGEMMITGEALQMMQQSGVAQSMLDEGKALESIGHFLKSEIDEISEVNGPDGQVYIKKTWKTPKNITPLVNDEGYYFIMNTIGVSMQKGSATGNINAEDANLLINFSLNNLAVGLYQEIPTARFGIDSFNQANLIIDQIGLLLKTHVSKSVDMAMVKNVMQHVQVNEIRDNSKYSQQQMNQPKLAI